MVVRHRKIEFASGAIVFPGGSLDASDRDPRLPALSDGVDGLDEATLALRVAAAREAFEECGVLLARDPAIRSIFDGMRAQNLGDLYRARLKPTKSAWPTSPKPKACVWPSTSSSATPIG